MEEVGIKRMAAADQRRSETPEREELLDEKLQSVSQRFGMAAVSRHQSAVARRAREDSHACRSPEAALALARCDPHPAPTHIMVRGQPACAGRRGRAAFSCAVRRRRAGHPAGSPIGARSAGRRRVLAEWIASPRNMLTARVIVNRVWQHHFGRGIVRSANNFGELGTPPTHPELLDWLALWLIDHDWQLKPLHRLIMTSSAYHMSSSGTNERWRSIPRTTCSGGSTCGGSSAEEIRDSTLVSTGEFNPKMYGPSFYPKLSHEVLATQSRPGDGWGDRPPEEAAAAKHLHVHQALAAAAVSDGVRFSRRRHELRGPLHHGAAGAGARRC